MSKTYVMFTCIGGNPTDSTKCSTTWPSGVSCNIPIGGLVNGNYYNLMIMSGDEELIENWVNDILNLNKLTIITKEEADILGQSITVPGTENIILNVPTNGKETVYVAGVFDVDHPELLWSVKEVRDTVVEEEGEPIIDLI